jgi:hypothetical protein
MESLGVRVTDTCPLASDFRCCAATGVEWWPPVDSYSSLGLPGLLDSGCRVSQPSSQSVSSLISVFFLLRSRAQHPPSSSLHSFGPLSVSWLSLSLWPTPRVPIVLICMSGRRGLPSIKPRRSADQTNRSDGLIDVLPSCPQSNLLAMFLFIHFFSSVSQGLPLHLQIDTFDDPRDSAPVCHRGYCQIKVFCDKVSRHFHQILNDLAAPPSGESRGRRSLVICWWTLGHLHR